MTTRSTSPTPPYNGTLSSRMGAFYAGSHTIFRNKNLHTELNQLDWFSLYLYSITGRFFTANETQLLQAIWSYTSYPDVRLWNNRVAALSCNNRSTATLGLSAALAVSEAKIYGRGIDKRAITFLIETLKQLNNNIPLEQCIRDELKAKRSIAGFGRPILNGDERNEHILRLAKKINLDQGQYLQLAFDIEKALINGRWRMKMNYAAVVAALAADLGFSAQEYYLFMFPTFLAGMTPCLIEADEQQENSLYKLSSANITYQGKPYRSWQQRNQ